MRDKNLEIVDNLLEKHKALECKAWTFPAKNSHTFCTVKILDMRISYPFFTYKILNAANISTTLNNLIMLSRNECINNWKYFFKYHNAKNEDIIEYNVCLYKKYEKYHISFFTKQDILDSIFKKSEKQPTIKVYLKGVSNEF